MKEFEIEVIYSPSGQYFTMTAFYNDDVDEEYVWTDISNNLSINVVEA